MVIYNNNKHKRKQEIDKDSLKRVDQNHRTIWLSQRI